jgi:hypothetical protein
MADDKQSRDEQADREKERQQDRMQEEARTRTEEEEPMRIDLGELDDALTSHDYPATTEELVEAYGEYEIETQDGKQSLADVLSVTDDQTYDSAENVRIRILGLLGR